MNNKRKMKKKNKKHVLNVHEALGSIPSPKRQVGR
jgi:hypothetical protein